MLLINKDNYQCHMYTMVEIYRCIHDLNYDYPGFNTWWFNKVIKGIRNGERTVVVHYVKSRVAAIAVLKHAEEKKLCCIRIMKEYRGQGLAKRMFDYCFNILDTCFPPLTVSEFRMHLFKPIFRYYGFKQSDEKSNLYLPDCKEIGYNDIVL